MPNCIRAFQSDEGGQGGPERSPGLTYRVGRTQAGRLRVLPSSFSSCLQPSLYLLAVLALSQPISWCRASRWISSPKPVKTSHKPTQTPAGGNPPGSLRSTHLRGKLRSHWTCPDLAARPCRPTTVRVAQTHPSCVGCPTVYLLLAYSVLRSPCSMSGLQQRAGILVIQPLPQLELRRETGRCVVRGEARCDVILLRLQMLQKLGVWHSHIMSLCLCYGTLKPSRLAPSLSIPRYCGSGLSFLPLPFIFDSVPGLVGIRHTVTDILIIHDTCRRAT